MTQYIIATFEGITFAPNGGQIENLQILGIESGKSPEEAWERLLRENSWISSTGFSKEKIIIYTIYEDRNYP
jgi:hypothetical protein